MSKVQIQNVVVLNNPANFSSPFQFEITFDCMENLEDDLEWKLTYVGSAESEAYDQVLDTIYVGPVPEGRHMFVFQADPANPAKIPQKDLLGATVVLVTCSYHEQEFVRVGYFVHNDYEDPELKENPPEEPDVAKIHRNIMAEEPRVTRFRINWGDGPKAMPGVEEDANGVAKEAEAGPSQVSVNIADSDSMQEPLPSMEGLPSTSSFRDVHSMDESSNVGMEMAF
jgi:histone chaperone ASF1